MMRALYEASVVINMFFVFWLIMYANWRAYFYFRDKVELIKGRSKVGFFSKWRFRKLLRSLRRKNLRVKNTAV
jgi:hypothetical protein